MPTQPVNEVFMADEVNLRDYWRILLQRRRLIVGVICAAALLTACITLLLPDTYQGKAVFIPLGKPTSSFTAILGELGTLLPFGSGAAGNENPMVRLLVILQSRTMAEDVIQRLDLIPILFADDWEATTQQWQTDDPPTLQDAVRALGEIVSSVSDVEKGIITITAEHADPVLAAAIVNQYIASLQRALNDNAFSLAKKNRLFIATQLQQNQRDLVAAEETLKQFEQTYGIVALDVQTQAAVSTLAGLEGQIMAREVQLGVLQRTLTGSSREVYLLQEELQGLRAQLAKLQYGAPGLSALSGTQTPDIQTALSLSLDKAPEIKLQYARLQREALLQNRLFALLTQQLEQAKIDEVRDETAFQLLDKAIPPETRIKPKRTLSVMFATMLGTFFSVVLAFVLAYLDPTVRTKEQVERQIGAVLLATVPPLVPPSRHRKRRLVQPEAALVWQTPSGTPVVEALRYLHARLKHLQGERSMQAVLLASPGHSEALAMTLANLAIVAAQLGERTLLIDSNVRQPTLHHLFQSPCAPGLAELLLERAQSPCVQTTRIDNLQLLPAGTVIPQTFSALESPRFETLLTKYKKTYDMILCAAPPVLDFTDAVILSSQVDATCLVLTCGVSRLDAAVEARSALAAVQANIIGAILTDFAVYSREK